MVTCRATEYEREQRDHVQALSRATVVMLNPVSAKSALSYLSASVPDVERWQPVFAHLRADPRGPLSVALRNPMMLTLFRLAYRDPGSSPAELMAARSQSEITDRLLDAFVTSAFSEGNRRRRWLAFLARCLTAGRLHDLHWWQIEPGMSGSRLARAATAAVVAALAGLAVDGAIWVAATATLAVLVSAGGWLRPLWPHAYRMPAGPPRPFRRLVLRSALAIGGGALVGLVTGQVVAGLVGGVVYALLRPVVRVRRPSLPRRAASPLAQELAHNRRIVAAATAVEAGVSAFAFAVAAFATGTWLGVAAVVLPGTAAAVFGGTAALAAGGWTWIAFRLTHARHALRGRLPWRLGRFLDVALDRGVLRVSGVSYQFRYASLQDRLAGPPMPPTGDDLTGLRERADAGDRYAAFELGAVLYERGRTDELATRARRGDREAALRLARLLSGQGRTDEAVDLLRDLADRGDRHVAPAMAALLFEGGRLDELRRRAEADDGHAALWLAWQAA